MIGMLLTAMLLTAGSASAWGGHHRGHFGFGFFIGPPVIVAPPPVYYRGYYPPYRSYGPGYYDYGYRVWVPGYWEEQWTPYGWDRVWIPGYWRYGP